MGVETTTANCVALRSPRTQTAYPVIAGLAFVLLTSSALSAAPAIRTGESNRVPGCATPERLTAFLVDRNPGMDPRYRDIARWYKHFGEAWNVRWDYAFYQMILETNALKYRRGDGRRGDVHEKQNNFAGIGATGNGAPGDRYPDIKTGVHAQIQHLVAYSGEMVANPVAPRTQLVQDGVVQQSRRLRRAVTFGDLARRWAVDRAYAKSIDGVAEQFRTGYCNGVSADAALAKPVPAPQPAVRKKLSAFAPPSGLGGPKPLMLAGPDTLPWTGAPAQQNSAQAVPQPNGSSAAAPPVAPPRKVAPVRTIWSRDGSVTPAATLSPAPAQPAPIERQAEQAAATAGRAERDASPNDAPALLPQFKIQPLSPPPSKLGGPADVMAIAPTETQPQSSARFRQVIGTGPGDAMAEPAGVSAPCRVSSASYGGSKTLLVRASSAGETRYTALTVLDGFEKSMFDTFTKAQAPGAEIVGEYASKDEALADARTNCPG